VAPRPGRHAREDQGYTHAADEADEVERGPDRRPRRLPELAQTGQGQRRHAAIAVVITPEHSPLPAAAATEFRRRTFLDALLAVGFVSTAAAIAYPVVRFLVPPVSGEPATQSAVAGRVGA